MFLQYYGLREQPFGVTPNPRFLYHGPAHREALASLIYGIEADLGFAALIAEPGMGKTTLLFYLLEKFRPTARTALVFQTQCTPLEMLRYVANELEVEAEEDDPVVLNDRIRQALVRDARAGRRVILIVDEAQNLSEESLEAIRLLSDFETPDFKLLHIILAGQPKLAEKLAQPGLSQLLQRIAMLNRLLPFTAKDDVARYIAYRLKVAGYSGPPIFTEDGLETIARHSGGIPRQINRLCFNALSLGCVTRKRYIDAEIVREVVNDLDLQSLLPGRASNLADFEISGEADSGSQPFASAGSSPPMSRVTPVSTSGNGHRSDSALMPDMVARSRSATPAVVAEGNLALSASAEFAARAVDSANIRQSARSSRKPRLISPATQRPTAVARIPETKPAKAERASAPAPKVMARPARPAAARSNQGLSLALIVVCVVAVPLLILAAWKYAEHQHLLPGDKPVAAPTSVESTPQSVESGDSVSLPPASPSNDGNDRKPKKQQRPRSELRLGPAPVLPVSVGTQVSFSGIESFVQS